MSLRKHISKGSFGNQVITIAAGNLLAQLIPFLVLPFLQKYFYGPEAFGILTIYVSISELLIGIAGFKYEYAIVSTKRLKDTVNILAGAVLITCLVAICTLVGVTIFHYFFNGIESVDKLQGLIFLIPVSVFAFGIYNSINFRLNRQALFFRITGGKVTNTFFAETSKLASGFFHVNGGLVMGRATGHVAAMLYAISTYFFMFKKELKLLSWKHIKNMLITHKRHPFFVMPSALTGTLITVIYLQYFLYYFGAEKVGLLGVSVSYIGVALGIISSSFGEVFFRNISATESIAEVRSKYIRFAKLLCIPAIAMCVSLYAIPSSFVIYMLGDKWAEMLPITRIMALWMSISFVSSSLSFIYLRLHLQRMMFIVDVIHLIAVIIVIPVSYHITKSFTGVLYGFAIVQAAHYITAIFVAIWHMNSKIKA